MNPRMCCAVKNTCYHEKKHYEKGQEVQEHIGYHEGLHVMGVTRRGLGMPCDWSMCTRLVEEELVQLLYTC